MPLQCNIDARGKFIRLIYGLVFLVAGVVLTIFWARGGDSNVAWIVSLGLIVGGAFAIFEARSGWCVVRAIGIKMPF